jgi:hypothetical protein
MAFTRFHDDPNRKIKQLQQSTGVGRYHLSVPGNGDSPAFMLDPHIIAQKWGGNLWTNTIDLESTLLGVNGTTSRDCLGKDDFSKRNANSAPASYPTSSALTTEQPRAIAPAWTIRDNEQVAWQYPLFDPQENVCFRFENNLSTRILEKDYFVRDYDCFNDPKVHAPLPAQVQFGTSGVKQKIGTPF